MQTVAFAAVYDRKLQDERGDAVPAQEFGQEFEVRGVTTSSKLERVHWVCTQPAEGPAPACSLELAVGSSLAAWLKPAANGPCGGLRGVRAWHSVRCAQPVGAVCPTARGVLRRAVLTPPLSAGLSMSDSIISSRPVV